MRKLLFFVSILFLCSPLIAHAAWTTNSVTLDSAYYGATETRYFIKADLSSDGAAETAIDLWTTLQAGLSQSDKIKLDDGGYLYAMIFLQGTDWNGTADFDVTVYNGYSLSIFSQTVDYNEAGSGSVIGGYYDCSVTEGQYPVLANGLIIDVGDIGNSGDDIILIFVVVVR